MDEDENHTGKKAVNSGINVNKVKIIDNIKENCDDPYSWTQLNCFNRAWSILYGSFNSGYFDLFLFYLSYFNAFMVDGYFTRIFEAEKFYTPFMEFAKDILEKRFGLCTKQTDFLTEDEMHNKIMYEIDQDRPVLVPGDLMNLYYDSGYQRESHAHYFIIKGYDAQRKIYFVLDNMHLDGGSSTVYKDFVIKYSDIYHMNLLFVKNFCSGKGKPFFWSIGSGDKSIKAKANIYTALKDHYDHLKRVSNSESEIRFLEIDLIKEIELHNNISRTKVIFIIANLKTVYYDLLFKFLSEAGAEDKELEQLRALKDVLLRSWSMVRVKIKHKITSGKIDFKDLNSIIQENTYKEKQFREKLIELLQNLDLDGSIEKCKHAEHINGFVEVNKYNDNIITKENKLIMVHTQDKRNDLWITTNDAPQVLIFPEHNCDFSIESGVTIYNEIGLAYLPGIIIRFSDGAKLIYGNERRERIVLYLPENSSEFTLAEKPYSSESVYLKAEKTGKKFYFYYKACESDAWIEMCMFEYQEQVKSFGLVSKTWEAINSRTEFWDISYELKYLAG
jgi:hypothetical protein